VTSATESAASDPLLELMHRARLAMVEISTWDQSRIDEAVTAVAWSLYRPEHARELAELAVRDTGLGNIADKIIKNQRKTFGTLRDLMRTRTVGILDDQPVNGVVRYGKPVGVVAAITPSTNPAATPINKAIMAIKGANAIILAPSPAGWSTTSRTAELAREALARIGAPEDLIQVQPAPVTREATTALMELADLVVATGSQRNVRAAYRSGTPSIGVGAGNVPVIIDVDADLDDAASKIAASKTFDNATSCSSENSLVIIDDVYEEAIAALIRHGAHRSLPEERDALVQALFPGGALNRDLIASDYAHLHVGLGLAGDPTGRRYVLVEEDGPSPDRPLTGEKLSLVLTLYRAEDFDDAKAIVRQILDHQGAGHSMGIHTGTPQRAHELGAELPVVRVIVNQAHAFGNGGSFDNGMPFTLTMGCGTWAGNSISENLNVSHFINVTHVVSTIEPDEPTEEELFGRHWAAHGRN